MSGFKCIPGTNYTTIGCVDCPVGFATNSSKHETYPKCETCALAQNTGAANCLFGEVITIAGTKTGAEDGVGTFAKFSNVQGMAFDEEGNIVIADDEAYMIRYLNLTSMYVSTIAGRALVSTGLDGVGTYATFRQPIGVVCVGKDIYVADSKTFRRIDGNRTVTTIAGSMTSTGIHKDGFGTNAVLSSLFTVTYDSSEKTFYCSGGSICKIKFNPATDVFANVTTLTLTTNRDKVRSPRSIVFYQGYLYVNGLDYSIHKIDVKTGVVETIFSSTKIYSQGFDFDPNGDMIIGDARNNVLWRLDMKTKSLVLLASKLFVAGDLRDLHIDGFGAESYFYPQGLVVSPSGITYFGDNKYGLKTLSTGCSRPDYYHPTTQHGDEFCVPVPTGYYLHSQTSNVIYKNKSFVSNMPTLSPTVHPTLRPSNQPVVASNSSSLSTLSLALIIALPTAAVLVAVSLLFWRRWSKPVKEDESYFYDGEDEESKIKVTANPNLGGKWLSASSSSGMVFSVLQATSNTSGSTVSAKQLTKHQQELNKIKIIPWEEITLSEKDCVIGKGSFGVVVKAEWTDSDGKKEAVAIKIISQTIMKEGLDLNNKVLKQAVEEMSKIQELSDRLTYKDCIVQLHGMVFGKVPRSVCTILNVGKAEAVGIVMRFEGGGSLDGLVHKKMSNSASAVSMTEKVRLLTGVARCLAELHAAGVVHADVKPDNVLLSDSSSQPEVRLADFGQSLVKEGNSLAYSTLVQTTHARGTPVYSAPETLHNPYNFVDGNKIAKASRKTDMYSFAILAWEVLSGERPFTDVTSQAMLSAKVHQGQRPPLDRIPKDCPPKIVAMMEACWSSDRAERKSAMECFSILQHCHSLMSRAKHDIFISHDAKTSGGLPLWVFHRLTQLGYRVWLNETTPTKETETTEKDADVGSGEIVSCRAFIVFGSSSYQNSEECMEQLRTAKNQKPSIPILPLILDANRESWVDQEFVYLCQLLATSTVVYDLSELASHNDWFGDEQSSIQMMELHNVVDKVVQQLVSLSCVSQKEFKSEETKVLG